MSPSRPSPPSTEPSSVTPWKELDSSIVSTLNWNVDSQAVGESHTSLKYLAPYVFKVAISNSRIVKVEDRTVTFKYREHGTNLYRIASLDVLEFIRRFLQHVLPNGFMKVRHYGFLAANCAVPIDTIRALIDHHGGPAVPQTLPELPGPRCPNCGGAILRLPFTIANRQPPFALALRDTG